MAQRKLTFDYFTASRDLTPLFRSLNDEALFDDKQVTRNGEFIRVHELSFRPAEGVWLGVVGRIKTDFAPGKASLTKEVTEDLLLEEDEGIAEKTVFAYEPTTRWLLYHFKSSGLRISGFTHYLNQLQLSTRPDEIEFRPMFDPREGVDRLLKSNRLSSLQFRVSVPNARDRLRDHQANMPTKGLLDFTEYFEAPDVEVTIRRSKGVGSGFLPTEPAVKFFQWIIGAQDVVGKAKASFAEENEDRIHPVDLLHDRLKRTVAESLPRLQSEAVEVVKNLILQAFNADKSRVLKGAE